MVKTLGDIEWQSTSKRQRINNVYENHKEKKKEEREETVGVQHAHHSEDERQRKRQMNWRSVQYYLTNKEV